MDKKKKPVQPEDTDGRKQQNQEKRPQVSEAVIRRMPRYYRYLGELLQKGVLRISSGELSALMGVTSSQIRQDFNCFGGFGQQGYGYNLRYLYSQISEILGVSDHYTAVILGVGNLGRALIGSPMFSKRNVTVVGVFDKDPTVIGSIVRGYTVMDIAGIETFLSNVAVDIAVLAVPKAAAPETAQTMARCGVRGIWNFSNAEMDLEKIGVPVENVHMSDSLMRLMYRIRGTR